MTPHRPLLYPPVDAFRAARLMNVLAGGGWNDAADVDLAARITGPDGEGPWPHAAEHVKAARDFHYTLAKQALADGFRGIILAAAGLPLGGEAPHDDLLVPYPDGRITYVTPVPAVAELLAQTVAGKVQAAVCQASARDPEGMLGRDTEGRPVRPEIAGLPEPWCVIIRFSLHWWPPEAAADLLARYGKLLPSGSLFAASVIVPGTGACGDEVLKLLGEAGGAAYRHSAADIRGWMKDAGMRDITVRDVRAPWQPWASAAFGVQPGTRILGAVGRVP